MGIANTFESLLPLFKEAEEIDRNIPKAPKKKKPKKKRKFNNLDKYINKK